MTYKIQDFIGRRFNRLIVESPAEPDKNGKRRWNCKCNCGTQKVVHEQSLGKIISCGCYNKEATAARMSKGWSKIFTKEFLEQEHIANKRSLRSIAKLCGCSDTCVRRYMEKHNIESQDDIYDISGKQFDKLEVIDLSHTKDGCSYWNVMCKCGTKKVVKGASLVRHRTVSCGCWNKEKDWEGVGDLSKTYWSRLISRASKRKLSVEITMDYAWELFNKQEKKCALSGVSIIMDRSLSHRGHKGTPSIQTASLDRIDSTRGYVENNVQWVHRIVNRMKSNLTEDEFIQWCKEVTLHALK